MAPYCTCHPHYGCCDPQHSRGEQAVNSTPASARRWCLLTPATLQVQALHVRIVQFGSLGVLNTVNRAPSNDTNLFSIGKINKLQRLLCKDAHLHSLKTHVVNALMVSCTRYKVDRGAWYKEKVQAKWPHGTSVLRMAMLRPPHGWECCLQPKTLAYITKPHEEEENHRNTLLSTNTYQFLQQSNSWTHKLTSWRVPNLSKAGGFCFPHNLRTSLPIKSTLLLEQSLCPAMSTSSPPQGHPALLPLVFILVLPWQVKTSARQTFISLKIVISFWD